MTVNTLVGFYRDWVYGSGASAPVYAPGSFESSIVDSRNHSRTDGVYREGGPFFLKRVSLQNNPSEPVAIYRPPNPTPAYTGKVTARVPDLADVVPPYPEDYGPELYAKAKPAQPSFALGNAVYELKDLPGMLKQELTGRGLKSLGSYALALEFGWKPLLRDIRDMVTTTLDLNKRVSQLLRDNGRPVRRRVSLPTVLEQYESEYEDYAAIDQAFVTQCYHGRPKVVETYKYEKRIWFSGQFRYWINPMPGGFAGRMELARRIYGLTPSPRFVYNAVPWSWLADWFTNVGDNLANMDIGVADRLINDYGYAMVSLEKRIRRNVLSSFYGASGTPYTVLSSIERSVVFKTRAVAHPFGFRIKDEELSGHQYGILASLLASRQRRF